MKAPGQPPTNLQPLQKNSELSLYTDDKLDQMTFAHGMKRIKQAFPKLPADWYDLLKERCKEKNFTKQQFYDAVNNLVDTCVYPEPTIAQILNWNQTVESFTYQEILDFTKTFSPRERNNYWNQFIAVDIEGKMRYVKKEHQTKLKLKLWENKVDAKSVKKEEIKKTKFSLTKDLAERMSAKN